MAQFDCKIVGTLDGGPPLVLQFPMKAGQTFQLGEVVRLDSADTLQVAVTALEAVGVAADYATTTPGGSTSKAAGTLISVWPFNLDNVFSMKIVSGTITTQEIGQGRDFAISGSTHGVAGDVSIISLLRVIRVDPLDSTRVHVTGAVNDNTAANKGSQFIGNATRSA